MADCDIIIPVWNKLDLTRRCLDSIYSSTSGSFGLILVDNGSSGDTNDFLKDFRSSRGNVVLIENKENLGLVKAVNQALKASTRPYVCVMNNDTIVRTEGWLNYMIDVAKMSEDIGLVNPYFEAKKSPSADGSFTEIDFCRGYCVLIKRVVLDSVGLWDEGYGIGYFDDHDYSIRAIRAGFRYVRANNVVVEHIGDSTFSAVFTDASRKALYYGNKRYFRLKWGMRLNVVVIVTAKDRKEALQGILLALARRQHIVYLWTLSGDLGLRHINIRQISFLPFFHGPIFRLLIFLNRMKKDAKKYHLVFTDDASLGSVKAWKGVHVVDFDRDGAAILERADSVSKEISRCCATL